MIASRRPNLQPAELAKIALRTFDTPTTMLSRLRKQRDALTISLLAC